MKTDTLPPQDKPRREYTKPRRVHRTGSGITLYIPYDLMEEVDRVGARYGTSRSGITSRALRMWLDGDEAKRLMG